jgi:predicted O-methyltransferase YrrM
MGLPRKLFYPYKYAIVSRLAGRKLRRQALEANNDIEKLVNTVLTFTYRENIVGKPILLQIKPLQVKSEIMALCEIVKKADPKVIVEIGTACGGTLFLYSNIIKAKRIVSIDLPGGKFGGGYAYWRVPLYKSFAGKNTIQLLRGDSHSQETVSKLQEALKGDKIDFLFIDGDHTYEGVKRDFEIYSPLVKKGGLVVFHDVAHHDPASGCFVDQFWNEIKQKYPHKDIIENKDQGWAGIGVLFF